MNKEEHNTIGIIRENDNYHLSIPPLKGDIILSFDLKKLIFPNGKKSKAVRKGEFTVIVFNGVAIKLRHNGNSLEGRWERI